MHRNTYVYPPSQQASVHVNNGLTPRQVIPSFAIHCTPHSNMKFTSTIATASISIGDVVATATADAEHVERALLLGGKVVQKNAKTYTAGIRSSHHGDAYCGGVLIDPQYVLTTAVCTGWHPPNFVAVGTHYLNGNTDGEVMKVVLVQNHTLFNKTTTYYNFYC